jgi:hypothetical protein
MVVVLIHLFGETSRIGARQLALEFGAKDPDAVAEQIVGMQREDV